MGGALISQDAVLHDPLVSVVVTSYKRCEHLKRAIESFLTSCTYRHLELILCDDGSPESQQEQMRRLPFDVFIFAEENRGLGVSVNRGLRAARGQYILYLQDDWVCTRRCDFVQEAVEALTNVPRLGLCRFTALHAAYRRAETVRTEAGRRVRLPVLGEPDSYDGIYVYSQSPHLKPRAFHERVGYFREDVGGGTGIEDEFCRGFLEQDIYRVGTVAGHEGLFVNIGHDLSYFRGKGRWRMNWRTHLSRNPVTRVGLKAYDALPENVRWTLRGTWPPPARRG